MKFKQLKSLLSVAVMILITSVMLMSCKCKIKDNQLERIAELRRQERSLQSELTEKQQQKARIDAELNRERAILDECDKRRELVKQRLAA